MLLTVLLLALGLVGVRLGQIQGVTADQYERMGLAQRISRVKVAAERGSIFDRNGNDLALSVPQWSVWANPWLVPDPQAAAVALAPLLGKPQEWIANQLIPKKIGNVRQEFVYLARKVDQNTWTSVKRLELPGVDALPESKRYYPAGDLAGSVVGLVGTDNNGLEGLERANEKLLAGRPGELIAERDPLGNRLPGGLHGAIISRRGEDVVLTLDQSIQFQAERVLLDTVAKYKAQGGRAIVVDVTNGDVLAMANITGNGGGAPKLEERTHNSSLQDVYEPGSTNKVITVSAALEAGVVTPTTHYLVPDKLKLANHVFSDHETHPPTDWTVTDILTNSSNVGTINIGRQVGKDRLDAAIRDFGLGTSTGVGASEESGILLDPSRWSATSIATVPIGNGLAVTALQMLDVYTTIANGGVWRQPRLVSATIDSRGSHHKRPAGTTRRVVSAKTAAQVNEMLRNVVRVGTGSGAAIPGYTVAGKTGTARKAEGKLGYSGGRYVASFVGFAPAEAPRLAAIVILDDPTPIYGGTVAAPAFGQIMQYALRAMRVPPPPPAPPAPGATGNGKAGAELDGPSNVAPDGSDNTPTPTPSTTPSPPGKKPGASTPTTASR